MTERPPCASSSTRSIASLFWTNPERRIATAPPGNWAAAARTACSPVSPAASDTTWTVTKGSMPPTFRSFPGFARDCAACGSNHKPREVRKRPDVIRDRGQERQPVAADGFVVDHDQHRVEKSVDGVPHGSQGREGVFHPVVPHRLFKPGVRLPPGPVKRPFGFRGKQLFVYIAGVG